MRGDCYLANWVGLQSMFCNLFSALQYLCVHALLLSPFPSLPTYRIPVRLVLRAPLFLALCAPSSKPGTLLALG